VIGFELYGQKGDFEKQMAAEGNTLLAPGLMPIEQGVNTSSG
jgi:hypothetical protein